MNDLTLSFAIKAKIAAGLVGVVVAKEGDVCRAVEYPNSWWTPETLKAVADAQIPVR